MSTSLAHNLSNSAAFDADKRAFFTQVREFGRDAGTGADALPKLAMHVVQGAYDGLIGEGDAKMIYEQYITAESSKKQHTAGGLTANTSKLRTLITLGLKSNLDGPALIQSAFERLGALRDADIKVKSAYAGYLDVARRQLADPTNPLTDADIDEVLTVEKKEKSVQDYLKTAAKALEKALGMTAEMNDDEFAAVEAANEHVGKALSQIIGNAEKAEKQAQLAKLLAELGNPADVQMAAPAPLMQAAE